MKRVVLALVVILALTGCTEIGSIADKTQIDLGLQKLTTELDELAGIETTYIVDMTPEQSYYITVTSTGPELDETQLLEVATLVRDTLGNGAFARQQLQFTFTPSDGAALSMSDFDLTDEDLAGDIAYAYALGDTYGAAASIGFGGRPQSGDTYTRSITLAAADGAPDWNVIAALPDESRAERSWSFAELAASGDLPPTAVFDLIDALSAAASPDADVYFDWSRGLLTGGWVADDVNLADPAASSHWSALVDMARLIEQSAVEVVSFSFYADGNVGTAGVVIGPCSEVLQGGQGDAALAAALVAAGVATAQPGFCLTT